MRTVPATIDLAFLGFGNVARRFAGQLGELADRLAAEGVTPRIVAVASRRRGMLIEPAGIEPAMIDESGGRWRRFEDGARFVDGDAQLLDGVDAESRIGRDAGSDESREAQIACAARKLEPYRLGCVGGAGH